jgi:hypothetical protein
LEIRTQMEASSATPALERSSQMQAINTSIGDKDTDGASTARPALERSSQMQAQQHQHWR